MAAHKGKKHRGTPPAGVVENPGQAPPDDNTEPVNTGGPQFGEPSPTPDPTVFTVKHGSDKAAYNILDKEKGTLKPRPFPISKDVEPQMTLADAIGDQGAKVMKSIQASGQIVFHALGDTGNTTSAEAENSVTDKLVSDFSEVDPRNVPSFCYNLGDVVYSFGEAKYYYDQFYDPYRDYPAPIFAIGGNHDGMVAPNSTTPTLQAFLENFCTAGQPFHRTPEAGGLARTAGIQPGVYFTLQADPFVRIMGLYSNCLEDPGVISTQTGTEQTYPYLTDAQTTYLEAALKRTAKEGFKGAIIIAVHHPPFVAAKQGPDVDPSTAGKHGGSPLMLADIDKACQAANVWPHAVLSGHAHNYQRFTRQMGGRETPFIIAGNGGHAHSKLTKKNEPALRTPTVQTSSGGEKVIFENYDDTDYGYLRVLVDAKQLRIEYHPASDGQGAKTPDDSVTVDLGTRKLVPYAVHAAAA
jgi:calcineurin-like phosphoesterase family protein